MFYTLSKALGLFTQPGGLLVVLMLLYFILKKKRFLYLTVIVFLVFSSGAVTEWLSRAWEIKPKTQIEHHRYGVVLTGGIINDLTSTKDHISIDKSADRIWQAACLYKSKKIDKIIISGASFYSNRSDYYQESLGARDFLKSFGVPDSNIILETRSLNTFQNAKFTAEYLKSQSYQDTITLITSASHMRRAAACFSKQNVSFETYSTCPIALYADVKVSDFFPDAEEWAKSKHLYKEWIGYLMYKLVGYI